MKKGIATHSHILGGLHGQRSLAIYSPWAHKELDMTTQLIFKEEQKRINIRHLESKTKMADITPTSMRLLNVSGLNSAGKM